jgi:hypothetical protein
VDYVAKPGGTISLGIDAGAELVASTGRRQGQGAGT